MHWQYGADTRSGWFHTINEDRSLLRLSTTEGRVPYAAAVIADGIGGSGDGELASELAVELVKDWLERRLPGIMAGTRPYKAIERDAADLFHAIHRKLREQAVERRQHLGTTLSMLVLSDSVYTIIHVGDCRVYRYDSDSNRLRRLTRDHTWVNAQVRKGLMTSKKARSHPKRHVLLQSLGMRGEPKLYIRSGYYDPESLFMLTSDGFHDCFSDGAIALLLQRASSSGEEPQRICDTLMFKAMERRPRDNISLLLIKPLGRKQAGHEAALRIRLLWHRWCMRAQALAGKYKL
ncbi:Protein phosphatase PrpC [Paenibacillus solanacearum]|uniref:Protein phosphatase PrpC n=1 Tax=Paenibacillus solanacearum TaxID=2048548 RepID=A0A916K6L1_9BACL|nr:Protein phosphatase PrpC [Paenibacillus solanacearum]